MRLGERRLAMPSEGRKTCKISRLFVEDVEFRENEFCSHPELLQRRLNSHSWGPLSPFLRDEWSSRNPSSALSLSSPHRWRTVIRFLSPIPPPPRFIFYMQGNLQHTYKQGRMDTWAERQTQRQTFPHCCCSPPNPVYVENEREKTKNKSAAEKFIGIPHHCSRL